ncbi:orotidine-5'-phosphate decarboxylase [Actinocatenispora sera]|uniref:orotidine-5'-phosphate decarboxylase n=1 Tax=Actinocatenispora sera TaxID=390989 RepID=UPI0033FEADBA
MTGSQTSFAARLAEAGATRPGLCVGIDPHPGLLSAWGLSDDAAGLDRFARTVVEALADRVAVLKPQSAFFERHGSRGVAVLETVIAEARSAGALVLVDAKRGDIGSTVAAYADAYLDPASPLAGDAVTASPYLGFGSLEPMFELAARHGKGVFVLALTSNPEGAAVQRAVAADGRTVAGTILDELAARNAGATPFGSLGAVVGATAAGGIGHDLAKVNGPLLAPGLGAQGGRPEDLTDLFGSALPLVLPAYSREILQTGPSVDALRASADTVWRSCASVLSRSA